MGKFTEDMATLVDKVRSSAGTRHFSLRATRNDTLSMLAHDQCERRARAQSLANRAHVLAAKLEQQHRERSQAAGTFQQFLKQARAIRHGARSAARSSTQAQLGEFHHNRGERTKQLDLALGEELAALRHTVGQMMSAAHATRHEVGADIQQARQTWRNGLAKTPRQK